MANLAKKISNFMHGLISAISASFQKLADWLDWPSPVSVMGLYIHSGIECHPTIGKQDINNKSEGLTS